MPGLDFPIILREDVQIVARTDDGFYIIKYKNNDGNNAVIWLPDSLNIHGPVDSNGGAAIEIVTKFITEQLLKV